jgi:hypothetical protein
VRARTTHQTFRADCPSNGMLSTDLFNPHSHTYCNHSICSGNSLRTRCQCPSRQDLYLLSTGGQTSLGGMKLHCPNTYSGSSSYFTRNRKKERAHAKGKFHPVHLCLQRLTINQGPAYATKSFRIVINGRHGKKNISMVVESCIPGCRVGPKKLGVCLV